LIETARKVGKMEKKELLELEEKCIQEESPWCTAVCPIHVRARKFVHQISQGKWQEARKILDEIMPLSGILGLICDHPCEKACKRGEAGGAIAISALERCCVETASRRQNIQALPSRGMTIAVLGDGLDSLTVCWDLVRKGYEVALFSAGDCPAKGLRNFPEKVLPEAVIEEELSLLTSLGLQVKLNVDMGANLYESVSKEFNAVYAGHEAGISALEAVDPMTLESSRQGVFTSGARREREKPSPIWDVAQGRRAALSMDRFLQNVSLIAGREKEGPYDTRLYTSIAGVAPLPRVPMADPIKGYAQEEAVREAKRCLQCQCLECVKVCEYLHRFRAYPKVYARDIYNNEIAIAKAIETNRLINACMLCGLCAEVCPNDFSMRDLCLHARRRLFASGKMPPSCHEFAIRDMLFSNGEKFALARHEPGKDRSAFLFFPGCQLSGSSPEQVEQVYAHLRDKLSGGVGLMLRCCGAMAEWAGREELFQESLKELNDQWTAMGKPQLIVACSTCYSLFKKYLPGMGIISLWEMLESTGLPPGVTGKPHPRALSVHDPCTSRHERAIQESVRRLLAQMGCSIEELPLGGVLTECCGYGGLMLNANPGLAREVAKRRIQESPRDYVAYCAMCRDSLAATGKRVLHVLDLIWGTPDMDPASRKNPGYSSRQEDRARLKRKLLQEIWGERTVDMEGYVKITLYISQEVRDRMEERHILKEDLQQVIEYAEKTGQMLLNPQTGRFLARYRPTTVTYWVEYSPSGDGYTVHRAYSHRMEIVEGKRS
jgi:Fe-S oxidoreductase